MNNVEIVVIDRSKAHTDDLQKCPMCQRSTRPVCHYCGHALTGELTNDGRTTCEKCGQGNWLGVGNAND